MEKNYEDQARLLSEDYESSHSRRSSSDGDSPSIQPESRVVRPLLENRQRWNRIFTTFSRTARFFMFFGIALCLLLVFHFVGYHEGLSASTRTQNVGYVNRVKPDGFKIVGMIFYGRKRTVDILDCYLRKNLAVNGGFLDEVMFVMNTPYKDDVEWLENLVKNDNLEQYYKLTPVPPNTSKEVDYKAMWDLANSSTTMYIKMDDDLVYIHDDAIPRLVHSLIDHPEAHSMQANVINNAWNRWMHLDTEAVHAFLPEERPIERKEEPTSWRSSALDEWTSAVPKKPYKLSTKPLPVGHRWKRLNNTAKNMEATPIYYGRVRHPPKQIRKQWLIGAQEHYSFLQNVEDGTLGRYWAGNKDGIWNLWYESYNINFMAIWGHTLLKYPVKKSYSNDESALIKHIPMELHMPVKVDTHALVSHYSFFAQKHGMDATDILHRYRALANECACTADNRKVSFPPDERHTDEIWFKHPDELGDDDSDDTDEHGTQDADEDSDSSTKDDDESSSSSMSAGPASASNMPSVSGLSDSQDVDVSDDGNTSSKR